MDIPENIIDFFKNPKYVAVVRDYYYDTNDHDSRTTGFLTPEDAFESAKKTAKELGFSSVSYWVEYDIELMLDKYSGTT